MSELRTAYHQQIDELTAEVVQAGAMVSESIARGTQALLTLDLDLTQQIIDDDDFLDALSVDIENRVFRLMALQAPMAGDLRGLVAALKINSDIERSGDLVSNIAKATRRIYGLEFSPKLRGIIERMSDEAARIFRLSIDAYAEQNAALGAALDDMDDSLDDLHADYIQAIFESSGAMELEMQQAVQLALVGRYYERIGDHAVNIGERVRFMVDGWMPEHTGAERARGRAMGAGAAVALGLGDEQQMRAVADENSGDGVGLNDAAGSDSE